MNIPAVARAWLLWVQGFVAVTAFLGGAALVLGSLVPAFQSVMMPPQEYLQGSPFASYLLPGLALALLLGGVHAVAFALLLRQDRWAVFASAAAAFAALIWIFVQMIVIPFSFLQAVYFIAGLLETGLVMLMLGLLPVPAVAPTRRRSARVG